MAAQWPKVKAWLVATIPTLPGLEDVEVIAGPPNTGDSPERYITVGFVSGDKAGTYQLTRNPDGYQWDEIGELRSEIVAHLGDSDPSFAESDAFAAADAIDKRIRSDSTLGGTLSRNATVESVIEVDSISNMNGTATALVIALHYTTTTL